MAVAREWGLPLAAFIVFASLILSGRLVTGRELERKQAILETELAYRETLRALEQARADRLEQALANSTSSMRDVVEIVKDIERDLSRAADEGSRRGRPA